MKKLNSIIINFVVIPTNFVDLFKVCRVEGYEYADVVAAVQNLVYDGELIEVKFSLKNQHGDCVGILFPKTAEVSIKRFF
jgi:hypothetical protein